MEDKTTIDVFIKLMVVEKGLDSIILLYKTAAHKGDKESFRRSYIERFENYYPFINLSDRFPEFYNEIIKDNERRIYVPTKENDKTKS